MSTKKKVCERESERRREPRNSHCGTVLYLQTPHIYSQLIIIMKMIMIINDHNDVDEHDNHNCEDEDEVDDNK